jgi:N6-adenosine-specific RNA methylase IME4
MSEKALPDQNWAEQINAAWNKSLGSIFDCGRLIIAAKDSLEHGQFEAMVDNELSFGPRTAQRLMSVYQDKRLSNTTHASLLPASWGTLYELTKLSDKQYEEALNEGIICPDMQRADVTGILNKAKRDKRIEETKESAVLSGQYPIILADPPWKYENPPMGGGNRSIENQYPTMTLEEICALPVADICMDDALLYLWATAPKLAECVQVIEAWGFEYRTNFVWVKDKIGMGYHARSQHELLLVAKKGKIPPPPVEARVSSVIYADRTEHSVKPAAFHELIESMYPELPRIELFSRKKREGWAHWGNEV